MAHSNTPTLHLSTTTSSAIDWSLTTADLNKTPITDLVLQPEQQGELCVLLRNDSLQNLNVYLTIQGEFPAAWFTPAEPWCAARQSPSHFTSHPFSIEPKQTLYKNLSFTLPKDFFESPNALAKKDTLLLQYANEISLYQTLSERANNGEAAQNFSLRTSQDSTVRLIGHQPFQLYTRPTRTYLEFLPEIYQQSDFLGRFLGITEQAFEPVYEATENFWAYLNPLTAPKALIPFLAEWVAWPMNPRWTLRQQRRLIRHAVEIYQWRGTRRGLQLCLHLCTDLPLDDEHIEITEADEIGFTLGEEKCLADEPRLGGGVAYHFTVTLRPETQTQAEKLDEEMLREMIEQEKPAFCTYDLTIMDC